MGYLIRLPFEERRRQLVSNTKQMKAAVSQATVRLRQASSIETVTASNHHMLKNNWCKDTRSNNAGKSGSIVSHRQ